MFDPPQGAIIDYIVRRHGNGLLRPSEDDSAFDDYVYRLHCAEGSAVTPFTIMPIATTFGKVATPLRRRVDFEMNLNLTFIDRSLADSPCLLGDFSAGRNGNILSALTEPLCE